MNDWLLAALKRASAIAEDSDRKAHAHRELVNYLTRVHMVACLSAISTERAPKLQRIDADGTVWLNFEWKDDESGWFLVLSVVREGRSPVTRTLELGADETTGHRTHDNPTDEEIRQALWDYFKGWKETR